MIKLGPVLVKGGWCLIHAIEEHPELCAKVLVARRRYQGNQPDPNVIVSAKYGIKNFLIYEWNNYLKIIAACPPELRQHFVTIHGIEATSDGQQALVMDLIRDDRNDIAPSLVKNTRPLGREFWATLERIRTEVFLAHSIDHFGIVRRNVLVKSPTTPVFIDFQTGRERYRGQFWLRWSWFVHKKINRCFTKLYQEMNVNPVTKS